MQLILLSTKLGSNFVQASISTRNDMLSRLKQSSCILQFSDMTKTKEGNNNGACRSSGDNDAINHRFR